jgi:hypothetical protein
MGEEGMGQAREGQRVGEPGEDREAEEGGEGGTQLEVHGSARRRGEG